MNRILARDADIGTLECSLCKLRADPICASESCTSPAFHRPARAALYGAGRTLFAEEAPCEFTYVIGKGCVRLVRLRDNGQRHVLGFFGSGSLLGLSPSRVHTASAEAVTDVRACRITRNELAKLMDSRPDIRRRLLRMALLHTDAAQTQVSIIARKTALGKFSAFLLHYRRPSPGQKYGSVVDLPMRREDIADYLCMATETVSRCINQLADEDIIALDSVHRVIIRNEASLRVHANTE